MNMELLGDLILIVIFAITPVACWKFANLYARAIDQILKDISDAVNGKYKSRYRNKKGK